MEKRKAAPGRISIVLPVYNGEKYIGEAIDSVLAQSYENWELIRVDDASTDGTPGILQEYAEKDRRIHVLRNETNLRLPASLNRGFQYASGQYFTWTSDDNRYYPEALRTMLRTLKKKRADLVFAREDFIDENGRKQGRRKKVGSPDEIYRRNIMGACFLYKRGVHEALGGYDPEKFLVEDYDFFLRAYEKFRFCYIPKVLYAYRKHGGSLTENRREEVSVKAVSLLKEHYEAVEDPRAKVKLLRGISEYYTKLSDLYFKKVKASEKGKREARRLKWRGLKKSLKRFL